MDTSYEASFSNLLNNLNSKYESVSDSHGFLIETLKRLQCCKVGYDLDSDEYAAFIDTLHTHLSG